MPRESGSYISDVYEATVGDCGAFCIQWGMSKTLDQSSQLALGYFNICIAGQKIWGQGFQSNIAGL